MVDMENLFELLGTQSSVQDEPGAQPLDIRAEGGQVEFQDVSFSYIPGHPVLRGVSFVARPGGTLALVGSTGSGKSTVLRLLFRFYDPSSGAVSIDGHDLRRCTLHSVRKNLGFVPQDLVLFNDTVRVRPLLSPRDRGGATACIPTPPSLPFFPRSTSSTARWALPRRRWKRRLGPLASTTRS